MSEELTSEEVIKDLCIRAIMAEGPDFQPALDELHAALRNHIDSLRAMAASALLSSQSSQGPSLEAR